MSRDGLENHAVEVAGLRERKRGATRQAILVAAGAVFRERGFDKTRMEDIARRADISPGTMYNYFTTKRRLLIALVALYSQHADKARKKILNDPPDDPVAALMAYHSAMLDKGLEYLDRLLWRHVYAAVIIGSWELPTENLWEREWVLVSETAQMLEALKKRGTLKTKIPIAQLAPVVRAVFFFNWQAFMADETMSLTRLKSTVRRQLRAILRD